MSKILVFSMQKAGSSSVIHALKTAGNEVDRGYEENLGELDPIPDYDAIYTLVRDPIARNISWFFEVNGIRLLQEGTRLERIKEELLDSIDHTYPLTWFDNVFFPATGVDVYKYPYPKEGPLFLGKICVLRTDTMEMEHRAETAITRPYGALYREFVDWVKFDDEYIDEMLSTKYVRHFFGGEIGKLWERWSDEVN